MKKIIYLILLICLLFIGTSCEKESTLSGDIITGTGSKVSQSYTNLTGKKIEIKNIYTTAYQSTGQVNVEFINSEKLEVTVHGENNIVESISVKSIDNEIIIDGGDNKILETSNLKIEISGYKFEEMKLSHVSCYIPNEIIRDDIEIELDDYSYCHLQQFNQTNVKILASNNSVFSIDNFNITNLTIDLEKNSVGDLAGNVENLKLELENNSNLNGKLCQAVNLDCDLINSSTVFIKVSKSIEYELYNHSILNYNGNPTIDGEKKNGSKISKY